MVKRVEKSAFFLKVVVKYFYHVNQLSHWVVNQSYQYNRFNINRFIRVKTPFGYFNH